MKQPADGALQRALPSADALLRTPRIAGLLRIYAREPVVRLVRLLLAEHRAAALQGTAPPSVDALADELLERVEREWLSGFEPVINATGVALHTNLGRAPLSREALEAMQRAGAYSDLEMDLGTGARGSRQVRVQSQLIALTGAEAAHVTVNAASALLLALSALARGRDVVVSRGQAVEIGGGFRIPDIMRQSGARLAEVGTTNRTRLEDYSAALTARTAAVLHVHSSNFRIVGFTESPRLEDLAQVAHESGVLLLDDNGSGSLLDTARFGLAHEPTPLDSLQAGVDAVVFSGDKLLGGPQSGIILGREDVVRRISRHPLARALRPDKIILAGLSATLTAYLRGDAERTLPLWSALSAGPEEIERRALSWSRSAAGAGIVVDLEPGESAVGGGSLPGETLPTTLIVLPPSVTARRLLQGRPAVAARARERRALLDLRTVRREEEAPLLDAVRSAHRSIGDRKNRVLESDT